MVDRYIPGGPKIDGADWNELLDALAAAVSGTVPVTRMAPGTTVTITKAFAESSPASHAAGSWPSSRPALGSGVRVIFVGDTDPALVSGLKVDGDLWFRA